MSSITDRTAEVVYAHAYTATPSTVGDPRMLRCRCGDDVFGLEGHAAHVAGLVVEALQLREEWAAVIDADVVNGVICPDEWTDSHAEALKWSKERCQSCDHCRNAQPKFIAERLIGPWVPVGGNQK